MFQPEIFRKQIYSIEKSICDIVATFRCPLQSVGNPHSNSTPP